MKNCRCSICSKPLTPIQQFGPVHFVVCIDCWYLDTESELRKWKLDKQENGTRIVHNGNTAEYMFATWL